jgi:RimJ/RimL family protein N-acetyltransferase
VVQLGDPAPQPTVSGGHGPGTISTADEPVAEVAWVVGTSWQRQGIATEAARALVGWLARQAVRTVIAHIHPGHKASAAVAAAAGLTPTGLVQDGETRWRLTMTPGSSPWLDPGRVME